MTIFSRFTLMRGLAAGRPSGRSRGTAGGTGPGAILARWRWRLARRLRRIRWLWRLPRWRLLWWLRRGRGWLGAPCLAPHSAPRSPVRSMRHRRPSITHRLHRFITRQRRSPTTTRPRLRRLPATITAADAPAGIGCQKKRRPLAALLLCGDLAFRDTIWLT